MNVPTTGIRMLAIVALMTVGAPSYSVLNASTETTAARDTQQLQFSGEAPLEHRQVRVVDSSERPTFEAEARRFAALPDVEDPKPDHVHTHAPVQASTPAQPGERPCIASTYGWGEPLNSHNADGTPFVASEIGAAHMQLPLGSTVTVTDIETGRQVTVVIRDRGPHPRLNRCIDLMRGAWEKLGRTGPGLIRVTFRVH